MNESQQRIAREAWNKIMRYYSIQIADGTGIEIILSAIERATDVAQKVQSPSAAELLPCPFCGGKPYQPQPYGRFERDAQGNRIDKGTFISCSDCGANIFRAPIAKAKLIPAWNRRPRVAECNCENLEGKHSPNCPVNLIPTSAADRSDRERLDWWEQNYDDLVGTEKPNKMTFRQWTDEFIADHQRVVAVLGAAERSDTSRSKP